MSTQAKLDRILQTKNEIKDAIIAKGVDVLDTDTFASYPAKISEIQAGGGFLSDDFITFLNGSIAYLWYKRAITKDVFDFIKDNISSFKNFDSTFFDTTFNEEVTPSDVLSIDLSTAESLISTFRGVCNMEYNEEFEEWDIAEIPGLFTFNIPISKKLDSTFMGSGLVEVILNSPKCTSFIDTFYGCNYLKSLQCDFSSATQISDIVDGCVAIETIDFATTTSKLTTLKGSFFNCYKLKNILNLNILNVAKNSFTATALTEFLSTTNLERLTFQPEGTRTINLSFDISHFTKMTADGAVEMFNSLPTSTATTTNITLPSSLYSSLTEDQISIATTKGWTILSA